MARLSIGLLWAFLCCFALATSVFPNGNSWQDPQRHRAARLEQLLSQPNPTEAGWRVQVWQQLKRLEHGRSELVLRGWQALAQSGTDQDLANLLIYQRRHALPLQPLQVSEGPEATLERCLHLWGSGQIPATREALLAAIKRFPQDQRFVRNLHWLDLSPPQQISWQESPREFALGVLAARQPHH